MILIISNNDDWSTNDVIEWIRKSSVPFKRLNFDDLNRYDVQLKIEENSIEVYFKHKQDDDQSFSSLDIDTIWFRRTTKLSSFRMNERVNTMLSNLLHQTCEQELKFFTRGIFHLLGSNEQIWLNHFESSYNDKLLTLLKAHELNIKVPKSLIANNKEDVLKFLEETGTCIIKPIYNINMFSVGENYYMPYTKVFQPEYLNFLNETTYPFMLQEKIEKVFEIRSFYIDGVFYSMAIFSQQSEQTQVDFRKYNYERPNRRIPYQLPRELENRLDTLMKSLNLNCGSIDLIKSTNDQYYFLEVNPVGQFGMVSYPCNYYLEEKISQFLIEAHGRK